VKQIRKRLTYANVMSSLAIFLVLGGASAFAAAQLGKNTVGTKQLKKNAVTAAKIKNNAVTGAKVDEGSLGVVPNATHATSADRAATAGKADTATTATKADSATTATKADSATTAGSAASAESVDGRSIEQIFVKLPASSTKTLQFGVFNMVINCSATGNPEIELDPQTTDTDLSTFGNGTPGGVFFSRNQGSESNSIDLSEGNDRGQTTFAAAQSGGAVFTGTIGYNDASTFGGESVCAVYGNVIS
jgi:hypothetical protein